MLWRIGSVWLLPALLALSTLACDGTANRSGGSADGVVRVVATVLPVENLALAIGQGAPHVRVSGLLPATGGCPHDYSLTPSDLKTLAEADLLLAVGLGYEPFLDRVRENFRGLRIVLTTTGIEPLAAEPGEDDHDEHGHHEHGAVNDHPFVSPKQAAIMARVIGRELAALAPADAATLLANAERTARALEAVHAELAAFAAAQPNKRVAAVSPVFAYLLRDAGLEPVAVLVTTHYDTLSAQRMAAVTRTLRAAPPAVILNERQFDEKVARTLGGELGVPVATIDLPTTGARGPTAFVDQARATARQLQEAWRVRP